MVHVPCPKFQSCQVYATPIPPGQKWTVRFFSLLYLNMAQVNFRRPARPEEAPDFENVPTLILSGDRNYAYAFLLTITGNYEEYWVWYTQFDENDKPKFGDLRTREYGNWECKGIGYYRGGLERCLHGEILKRGQMGQVYDSLYPPSPSPLKTYLKKSYNEYMNASRGGSSKPTKAKKKVESAWHQTRRTVMCRDGTRRTLFSNPARPGELRVRRMVKRNGHVRATYVLPK
jgi:hypothetical protein